MSYYMWECDPALDSGVCDYERCRQTDFSPGLDDQLCWSDYVIEPTDIHLWCLLFRCSLNTNGLQYIIIIHGLRAHI